MNIDDILTIEEFVISRPSAEVFKTLLIKNAHPQIVLSAVYLKVATYPGEGVIKRDDEFYKPIRACLQN
ncbi:hypothetical protein L0244_36895 [bacterium]|nr:hypothetical protein [bacterium]